MALPLTPSEMKDRDDMIRVMEFKTEYRAAKDPIEWVLIAPLGAEFEKTQTWHRVAKIKPDDDIEPDKAGSATYQDMIAKWAIIGPAYAAWKNGQELPDDGTPLSAWSGVTAEQAKFMRSVGVRTVEEVRDMGEATVEKLRFPNARKLPSLAASWLDGEQVAEKDEKILALEDKVAAMTEMLEESMKNAKADKPKRGRPPKQEVEAA